MAKARSDRILLGTDATTVWGDAQTAGLPPATPLTIGLEGGDDTLIGGATTAQQTAIGDWQSIAGGSVAPFIGGNDDFTVRSSSALVYGDAVIAYAHVEGGNDRVVHAGIATTKSFITGDIGALSIDTSGPLSIHRSVGGGNDTIFGANGGGAVEILIGDVNVVAGNVTVVGGNDAIRAREGTHEVYGDVRQVNAATSANAVELLITGGNDLLLTGSGRDYIVGDVGATDRGTVLGGNDTIDGGLGSDYVVGDLRYALEPGAYVATALTGGNDSLSGGEGTDVVVGDLRSGVLTSFVGGNDTILGNAENDIAFGDAVNLTVTAGTFAQARGGDDTLNGNADDDILIGDVGNVVAGRFQGGNDGLFGGLGNDRLVGDFNKIGATAIVQGGNDFLVGGFGNDTVDGSSGKDTAGFGADLAAVNVDLVTNVATGQGTDVLISIEDIQGSALGDTLRGNSGANDIFGGDGNDLIEGREGNDLLVGETGNDTIDGGTGDDFVIGDDGNDVLRGGAGTDQLFGGAGSDRLTGGSGNDALTGGTGIDYFGLGLGGGGDYITDWQDGSDRIDVSTTGYTLAQLASHITISQQGTSTIVVLDAGTAGEAALELANTSAALITIAADFAV